VLAAPSFTRKLLNFISWEDSRLKIENCSPSKGDFTFGKLKADYASPIPDILLFEGYQRFEEHLDLWVLIFLPDIVVSFRAFSNFSPIFSVFLTEIRASRITGSL